MSLFPVQACRDCGLLAPTVAGVCAACVPKRYRNDVYPDTIATLQRALVRVAAGTLTVDTLADVEALDG